MDALQILKTLAVRGAWASLDGTEIVIKPRSVLTDEIRAEIRANRSEIVSLLASGNSSLVSSNLPTWAPDAATSGVVDPSLPAMVSAIMEARRGGFFCYGSPGFASAWRWANALTGRNLTSQELFAWAKENEFPKVKSQEN